MEVGCTGGSFDVGGSAVGLAAAACIGVGSSYSDRLVVVACVGGVVRGDGDGSVGGVVAFGVDGAVAAGVGVGLVVGVVVVGIVAGVPALSNAH